MKEEGIIKSELMYTSPSFHNHQQTVSSVLSMPTATSIPGLLPQNYFETNPRYHIIYL